MFWIYRVWTAGRDRSPTIVRCETQVYVDGGMLIFQPGRGCMLAVDADTAWEHIIVGPI